MDVMVSTAPIGSGWIAGLLGLGLLCTAYFLYSFLRDRRYGRRCLLGLCERVEGRVVGRVGPLVYRGEAGKLERADEVLLVEHDGQTTPVIARAAGHRARVGSYITADGLPVTLLRQEILYREHAAERALRAVRVLVGCWPELRWLRVPAAIGCLVWLIGLTWWLFVSSPSGPTSRLFNRAPVEDVVPVDR